MSQKNTILTPFHHRIIGDILGLGLSHEQLTEKYRLSEKTLQYHLRRIFHILDISHSYQIYYGYRKYISSEKMLKELGLEQPK